MILMYDCLLDLIINDMQLLGMNTQILNKRDSFESILNMGMLNSTQLGMMYKNDLICEYNMTTSSQLNKTGGIHIHA